jgi:hypothetical protein
MKKVSREELSDYDLKTQRTLQPHPVVCEFYNEVAKLHIGEALRVSKEEWPLKAKPQLSKTRVKYSKYGLLVHAKFHTRTLSDESGWMIIRVE